MQSDHPVSVPEQLALNIFENFGPKGIGITNAAQEIGFAKANILINAKGMSLHGKRLLDAMYYCIATSDEGTDRTFSEGLGYLLWLANIGDTRNYEKMKLWLSEAQKASVQVNVVDASNPHKDVWISVPLLGAVAIRNRKVIFDIHETLYQQLKDPVSYTYLSLRISGAFDNQHTSNLYQRLLSTLYRGGTDWMTLEEFRDQIETGDRTSHNEFKYMKRDVLTPSVASINSLSNLTVSYETKAAGQGKRISHIKFTVAKNDKGKMVLRLQDRHKESLRTLYHSLVTEFGLSAKMLDKIVANREEYDDARLKDAVAFVRYRMKDAAAIKYPGKYLEKAIEDRLRLSDVEQNMITGQQSYLAQETEVEMKRTEAKGLMEMVVHDAINEAQASYDRLLPEQKSQLFVTFKSSSRAKGFLRKLNKMTGADEAVADPIIKGAFLSFIKDSGG